MSVEKIKLDWLKPNPYRPVPTDFNTPQVSSTSLLCESIPLAPRDSRENSKTKSKITKPRCSACHEVNLLRPQNVKTKVFDSRNIAHICVQLGELDALNTSDVAKEILKQRQFECTTAAVKKVVGFYSLCFDICSTFFGGTLLKNELFIITQSRFQNIDNFNVVKFSGSEIFEHESSVLRKLATN